jgi:hypothetical protein
VRVIFWVLNHADEFAQAFDECGADGVMTDYPSRLARYLRERDLAAGKLLGASETTTFSATPSGNQSASSVMPLATETMPLKQVSHKGSPKSL